MPVIRGIEKGKPYYRWGGHGKKYFYTPNNERSRKLAQDKAKKQGIAAHANGWRGK
jgi:hypothetical protein